MARIQPPRALTKKEFNKRIAEGARIFAEIDPAFCKYLDDTSLLRDLAYSIPIACIMFLIIVFFLWDM